MSTKKREEYRVLSRKYRPQTFKDMIGQEVLIRTISNAIKQDKIAHAFLFHGIRGVGKTTTARILAKAINCVGKKGDGGPTVNPCGVCEHCVAISEDRHQDVLEMDAASRTSVNDVRDIIESCSYRPIQARYKVFIIDEAHMLSNSAFNALLKTLEEPPGHTKFMLATTEIQKIPLTILSRCQRFDLGRYDADDLKKYLKQISKQESVQVDDKALSMIALHSGGSARDALSILDQAISYVDSKIEENDIRSMLGLGNMHEICSLFEAVSSGDVTKVMESLKAMYSAGSDPKCVLQDMMTILHDTIKCKHITPDESILGKEVTAKIQDFAKSLPSSFLIYAWQVIIQGLDEVALVPVPHQALEMTMLKLCHLKTAPPMHASPSTEESGQVVRGTNVAPNLKEVKKKFTPLVS